MFVQPFKSNFHALPHQIQVDLLCAGCAGRLPFCGLSLQPFFIQQFSRRVFQFKYVLNLKNKTVEAEQYPQLCKSPGIERHLFFAPSASDVPSFYCLYRSLLTNLDLRQSLCLMVCV